MPENVTLLIPACALALVCGGLILVGLVLLLRMVGGSVPKWLGGVDRMMGGDPKLDPIAPASRRRSGERLRLEDLDFDAAVARHAGEEVLTKPEAPDFNAQQFDVDTSSPISGRVMRDGRYRRVTGGTPGREKDEDFRRVEADEPPLDSKLPPVQGPLRKRRRKRGLSDDEVFGGMLDDDGDGSVDY